MKIETFLYKLRVSNNLIATLLAYGFGYTVLGHVLGAMTLFSAAQSIRHYMKEES